MCTIGRAQVALLPNVSDCAFSPGPGAAGPDGCAGGELTLLLAASRCDFTVVLAPACSVCGCVCVCVCVCV